MNPILKAEKLKKTFLYPAPLMILEDLDLEIHSGESIAICGRSGEGKSTLLHLLGTLETPDTGKLFIQGKEVTPQNASYTRSNSLGFVFQSYQLLEDFTALENVLMPAWIARKNVTENHGLFLLDLVGLKEKAYSPCAYLSGGEKQRVAIARALCNDPPLLLADEPSGSLDPENAKNVETLLFQLVKEQGKSLILVTHDTALANQASRTYLLHNRQLTLFNR